MHRGWETALICAAVMVVSGCSDDEPVPVAPPSSDASSSTFTTVEPSPTPTPPELPDAATTPDAAGAEAFVRHWFDLANYAQTTGDTEPLDAVSRAECRTCEGVIDQIKTVYRADGRIEGNLWTVTSAVAPAIDETQTLETTTTFAQSAGQEISSEGAATPLPAQTAVTAGVFVVFEDDAWALFDMGSQS